jgi:hypothetical protein
VKHDLLEADGGCCLPPAGLNSLGVQNSCAVTEAVFGYLIRYMSLLNYMQKWEKIIK